VYAQVFELLNPERGELLNRSIYGELLPALRTEEGFCGALSLVCRETGELLLLVLWETEDEAARPLAPSLAALVEGRGIGGTTSGRPEIWEVGARA
jgi:hypothetical protein